ncbi:MAG: glutathione S-transferase family protein [Gammaproteobacteria bacterium]|jgi:glutathione S-transferase
MLELYHHGSSACAAKVRFALAEKALGWEGHYVDILAGEQFSASYLAVNPKAVVPVLVHDGRIIPESTVICEYVEDAFPDKPIYPPSAYERAAVRLWTKAVDEELHPACSALTYIVSHRHTILRNGAGSFEDFLAGGTGEGRAARERKWRWIQLGIDAPGAVEFVRLYIAYLEKMEQALTGSRWLVGDALTMADIAMAPYVYRLACLALDSLWANDRLPNVARWYRAIASRPTFDAAFVKWLPEKLAEEMRTNGRKSRPQIEALLGASI